MILESDLLRVEVLPGKGTDVVSFLDKRRGLDLAWRAPGTPRQTMPYLWVWQECGSTVDYPWWGRAYVLGLEPFSSYPTNGLPDAVANGSALRLAAGETKTFWLTASLVEA